MPLRITILATGEVYHVLNRGVNHQPIFIDKRDYQRALEILFFYQFVKPPVRFSFCNRLSIIERENMLREMQQKYQKLVDIISFCFMPNHFHILLRQSVENGTSKFLANFQNSFTRYLNVRLGRSGHLFQGQFKAVRITNDEQLLHTSRYIHINPYTSYVVKKIEDLKTYPWSSLSEYLEEKRKKFCETQIILSHFSSRKKYFHFILDQKDYQRTLEQIKHLLLEDE